MSKEDLFVIFNNSMQTEEKINELKGHFSEKDIEHNSINSYKDSILIKDIDINKFFNKARNKPILNGIESMFARENDRLMYYKLEPLTNEIVVFDYLENTTLKDLLDEKGYSSIY